MYKILLVDDHDAIQKAYQCLLEEHGFTVITAPNPQDGLKILDDEQHPVVIVTDVKFPSGIDGFEFIRRIKKAHPNHHEVIVISGHANMDLVIEAIHLDASDFIPKPCEINLLLLAIKRASQKIEMRQTIKEYMESLEYMVNTRTDEIKRMEEQLVQAAKLSAMGELAASVCHELRQPLCGIMGFSYLAEREISEDSPAMPYLKKLDEQCERMRAIIENLRAFSRQSDASLEVMNIRDALEDAISLFRHQLKNHGIELEESAPADLPPVLGNKTKLQQVFVNLISNARDALDTRNGNKPKKISIRCEVDNEIRNIRVWVADNGIGIDESIKSRVFDSFFSTKSVEQGTGLGLSIARTIVSDHNGEISFLSNPAEGTSFVVRLPVSKRYDSPEQML
jgi:two-component system NtrC family sensor kinase